MSNEKEIKGVIGVLTELGEDSSIPKNVQEKLGEIINVLKEKIELKIRVNKALHELDEIADDPNLQQYTRTQIWNIVSILYWIFWLNLAVGLFNVLPMIPLDGGFLFNDAVGSTVKKLKKGISEENKERIVKNVSLIVSLIILFLIVMPFFIKYIP